MWLRNLNDILSLMFFGCSSRNQEVWVVGFGLVDSLTLVPFNLHFSFHLFCLVFYSWINPQTFGTRLKWSWLNKTPTFDHFLVDSTSHLHTLYCILCNWDYTSKFCYWNQLHTFSPTIILLIQWLRLTYTRGCSHARRP